MARDYFQFVTKFFEPINISATHIYHSALELSPLSSSIRRLYYYRRQASSPRVIVGNQGSWDQRLVTSCEYDCRYTWSPCGRFIAAENREGVEIRDPLSFELLSTLMPTEPTQKSMDQLACSMDGRSVASVFGASLVIWDIQTGGVVKTIEHTSANNVSLALSSNGSTVGIISTDPKPELYTVYVYDVASGAMHPPGAFTSADELYLWAHDASLQVMATARDHEGCTINIFEVGSVFAKIESFYIGLWRRPSLVGPFSQTTHRVSVFVGGNFFVFDARTSRCLLSAGYLRSQCFSPDGSLFAGILTSISSRDAIHVWKYTSDNYTPWREFPLQHLTLTYHSLQFSPTSSSLLARSDKFLHLLRLDTPSIVARPDHRTPLTAFSHCGSYMATGNRQGSIVTITNPLSRTPPHFIDTGVMINTLALTGNVLLALGSETVAAWRLTKEGAVDGVLTGGGAGRGDSIWTVSLSGDPTFLVGDGTVAIRHGEKVIHVYYTETGEVLEPTQTPLDHHHCYTRWDILRGLHHPHYHNLDPVSWNTMRRGWAKDPEGRCQLWIPVEWRDSLDRAIWSGDNKTLRFDTERGVAIIIKF